MRRLVGLAFLIMCGALISAAPALAEIETAAQQAARTNVEVNASRVGVATTQAQAVTDQKTLLPAVNEAIKVGAGKALLEHTTNPSVAADLIAKKQVKAKLVKLSEGQPAKRVKKPTTQPNGKGGPAEPGPVTAKASRHLARAHAAGCWNDAWGSEVIWEPIAWLYVRADGWCGNGYAMTWLGYATWAQWAWGIYCFAGNGHDYSWDYYPSWVRMANWGTLGVSYPWGCWGIEGGKAAERIAANGYWDFYDDYPF